MSRYDAALDADKLYNSLERLVARKGWRKLGARLRKNVSKCSRLEGLIGNSFIEPILTT